MPDMAWSESTGEVTMRPGFVHMVARVILARIMTHPFVSVDVRRIRMPRLVAIVAVGLNCMKSALRLDRTPRRNRLMRCAAAILREGRNSNHQQSCECNLKVSHGFVLPMPASRTSDFFLTGPSPTTLLRT